MNKKMNENLNAPDLTAEDLSEGLAVDGLDSEAALGSWGSLGTFGSASCPASASSVGSASSFG